MRKSICLIMALLTLLFCAGCDQKEESGNVVFYFLRAPEDYIYAQEDGVIAGEDREISDPNADLAYLLRLYLEGPVTEGLHSPFPAGTQIQSVSRNGDTLILYFSKHFNMLSDIDRTLACACICKTCFGLCDAENIRLLCEEVIEVWSRDSFTLTDDSVGTPEQ